MHPYEFLTKKNPDGLKQFVSDIKTRIAEIDQAIIKYAEEDGQPELADKDVLYSLFKRGVEEGLEYGLHEIFKHYYCILKKQILLEMLNERTFDERDVENLKYFHDEYTASKDRTNLVRIPCPSMLVFETTFALFTSGKAVKYESFFYNLIGYVYDALRKAFGATFLVNPTYSVENMFNLDIPDSCICRSADVAPMSDNEGLWLRNNSEHCTQSKHNFFLASNKRQEYASKIKRSTDYHYHRMLRKGCVRVHVGAKYLWIKKEEVILVRQGSQLTYSLRSEATKEQINDYVQRKAEYDAEFERRYLEKRGNNEAQD